MSRPISAGTTNTYFKEHFASASQEYFTEQKAVEGEWHGKLAAQFGLVGGVKEEHFERVMNGQDPMTGEQVIRHRNTRLAKSGKEMAHRASWDLTCNSSKSVSLTALVGGDLKVVDAHRASVRAALDAMQEYVQAHGGGDKAAINTRAWAVAIFDHSTARPERLNEGEEKAAYAAPHLHSHCLMANMSPADGKIRSIESSEVYRVQRLGKAIYQSELKHHLRALGYEVHEGKNGAAEIQGYSKEYLEAESLRSSRIKAKMEELGLTGRRAEEIIAHQGRNQKLDLTPDEVRTLHLARAAEFGDQPRAVVLEARERALHKQEEHHVSAQEAVTFAKRSITERLAVFDHAELVAEALQYGRGYVRIGEVERNIADRSAQVSGKQPELITVEHGRPNAPGKQYTTREMVEVEREVLQLTRAGRNTVKPLAEVTADELQVKYKSWNGGRGINRGQAEAAAGILSSMDSVLALQGSAGTAKTTVVLRIVQEYAKSKGFEVVGLAPTGRAQKELKAIDMASQTLQRFLVRKEKAAPTSKPRYFIVDESSLVASKQYRDLLRLRGPQDRALETGDIRQHSSVGPARIFAEQQISGMQTLHLTKIVRQQTPELIQIADLLQAQKAPEALDVLNRQGRVHVIEKRKDRLIQIAKDYAKDPKNTVVVDPANASREELNKVIRDTLQTQDDLGKDIYGRVLIARQDLTMESRKVASSYDIGTVIRYQAANRAAGVASGDYATVVARDSERNTVSVQVPDGKVVTYNPRKAYGVEIFRQDKKPFADGESITFRLGWKKHQLVTGDRATIESIDAKGNIKASLEGSGRTLRFNLREFPHLDYGYVSTSFSAQGITVSRVLVHLDATQKGAKMLLNQAMAYVSLTRARSDMQAYASDLVQVQRMVERKEEKHMALTSSQIGRYVA